MPRTTPSLTNYNWASWNLGKDELGAQTPVGKIAQALVSSVWSSWLRVVVLLQLRTTSVVALLGLVQVARTAGREALEGVLADVVMSASGEGNLSNLIKENSPDWYPTWVTALSIDQDDNPFEAAFKTALEGGMLGAPVGAVAAFFKGSVPSKFQKASPDATGQAELQQVLAFEAIQGELFTSVPKVKNQNLPAAEVATEFMDGNFSRINEVPDDAIRELVNSNGYDVTAFTEIPLILGKALGPAGRWRIFGQGTSPSSCATAPTSTG